MKRCSLVLIIISLIPLLAVNQEITGPKNLAMDEALGIFLDCSDCDMDYIKTNLSIVNYVTRRQDADVSLLVTSLMTGSGGMEYTMLLEGKGRFSSLNDTIVFTLPGNSTEEEIRMTMLDNIQLGLVPFLLKTPAKEKLFIVIDQETTGLTIAQKKDPWNDWMFEVSGMGSILGQQSSKNIALSGGLYISKITPDIKFESSNSAGYSQNTLRLFEGDSLVYSSFTEQSSINSRNLFVKSLGDHFGLGAIAGFRKSDYNNLNLQLSAGPAVEYNVFKYSDATSKQLRMIYGIFFERSEYNTMTANGRMHDNMYSQEFHLRYMTIKSWGSIYANAYATNYINDPAQYAFGADATASINVAKGLYLNISGGASYIRNQLSLPQDQASLEEIYLGDRQLETNYSYHLNVGISFRFGSIFNNNVNPRFSD